MIHKIRSQELLNGLVAPAGDGMVIEVHLDIMEANPVFLRFLGQLGFEDDPFLEFHPAEYRFHYTGRTRALQTDVKTLLPSIRTLVKQIIQEAQDTDIKLYAEIELVRGTHHFVDASLVRDTAALDNFLFKAKPNDGGVKADIHLEFCAGTVAPYIRDLLKSHCFYWVKTPVTKSFPSEEIATLQTSTFHAAQLVYESLIANPLPASTGIHLEQKLEMIPSHPDLSMPQMIDVRKVKKENSLYAVT